MTQIRQHGRKKVLKKFAIFCLGIFLNYAGYLVLLNLQSSINIEEGIGKSQLILADKSRLLGYTGHKIVSVQAYL